MSSEGCAKTSVVATARAHNDDVHLGMPMFVSSTVDASQRLTDRRSNPRGTTLCEALRLSEKFLEASVGFSSRVLRGSAEGSMGFSASND